MSTHTVGRPIRRIEDPRLLRGDGLFLEDLRLPGERFVAFVRSVHPHARFRVDVAPALDIPGVQAVFTAADLGSLATLRIPNVVPHAALRECQQPALAVEKVYYVGEPIAPWWSPPPALGQRMGLARPCWWTTSP